ncbi:MAG: deoxyribodipyrimidine photo-lyase [Chitinispirillaceae bacterium]
MNTNPKRIRTIRDGESGEGPVIYWMQRDQRVADNWALLHAAECAEQLRKPLIVLFCLVSSFSNACWRQYSFMLEGLKQIEEQLRRKHTEFLIVAGEPKDTIPGICSELNASRLIVDFNPLREQRHWVKQVSKRIAIPFDQVDAHNIVPCWVASNKQEFAARTIRPKIRSKLWEFMEEFPPFIGSNYRLDNILRDTDWGELPKHLSIEYSVEPLEWVIPGEKRGILTAKSFIDNKLDHYNQARNDPTMQGQSDLSPYLHFGQLSAQRVAHMVLDSSAANDEKDAFIEELVVRRELSDNFCYYNRVYDRYDGFPEWAKRTLEHHRKDARPHTFSRKQLEKAQTYDPLWNAAQKEMVIRGKMHGYMRMYWAKKILEWTDSVEKALRYATYLNDKYELDGRDPNGYVGCAWSIGGVHDRAWRERAVYGKVRYMSYNGAKSKFDVQKYIHHIAQLQKDR